MKENNRTRTGSSFHQFKKNSDPYHFPNDFAKHIDEDGETYFWEPGQFHMITSPDIAQTVLKSPSFSADRSGFFMSRMPNLDLSLIQDFFSVVQKMMVMADGKDHQNKRKLSQKGFDEDVLNSFRIKIEESVDQLISQALAKDQIEFAQDIANPLPSTVLADLFSIPKQDRPQFVEWSLNMTAFFGGGTGYENEDGIKVNKSAQALRDYFEDLMGQRRKQPGTDYFSSLLENQKLYGLTDEEVISQAIMMLVAGQVTTSDQICNNMFQIAGDANLQKQLKEEPSLIPKALEELKRFDPAVTFIFRTVKESCFLGEQWVEAGETLFISNHCVNRRGLKDGNEINIFRDRPESHFAYGYGPHYCIGARLARMEMLSLFEQISRRFPRVRVLEAERDHYSLSFSGFKKLILERA